MGKTIKEKTIIKNKLYSEHYNFEEYVKEDMYCENENDFDEKYEKEECDLYISETAIIIRNKILEYTDNNFYPLCEYLNFDNIENYIKWLLE